MFRSVAVFWLVTTHISVTDGFLSSSFLDYSTTEKIQEAAALARDMVVSFANQFIEDKRNQLGNVDAMLSGFTVGMRKVLPSQVPLFSLEDEYPNLGVYLCTNHGKVSDLKTIRKIDKNRYLWHEDESLDITVYYEVEKFSIDYSTFFFKSELKTSFFETPLKTVTGNVTLTYGKNRIAVKMHIPNLMSTLAALKSKTEAMCFVYVKRFVWEELSDLKVVIHTDSHLNTNDWLSRTMVSLLTRHHALMLRTMQKQVLMELYNMLPLKPVCRHEELKRQASHYEADKPRTFSASYDDRCGPVWTPRDDLPKSFIPNLLHINSAPKQPDNPAGLVRTKSAGSNK